MTCFQMLARRAFPAAILGAVAVACAASEIQAIVVVQPEKPGTPIPAVRVGSSELKLERVTDGRWTYSLTERKRVLGLAQFDIERLPDSYASVPIQVRVPYDAEAPIKITVFVVQVDESSQAVRALFGTSVVDKVDTADLFELYQRSALMASKRLAALTQPNPNRKLGVFDVQVFFKFLEVARELGWKANLAPGDEVRAVKSYLRGRMTTDRDLDVMARAITRGADDIDALLKQIDTIEAEQLKKVWGRIRAGEGTPGGSREACERYGAFRETLVHADPILLARWDSDVNYGFTALVNNVLALCLTREATKTIAESGTLSEQHKKDLGKEFGPIDSSLLTIRKGSQADVAIRGLESVARQFGIR